MKKAIIIIAIVMASMTIFAQGNYAFKADEPVVNDSIIMVYDNSGRLVCKAHASRPKTDQEKIDWFVDKHDKDMSSGIYHINSRDGKSFCFTNYESRMWRETGRFIAEKMRECDEYTKKELSKPAKTTPTLKTVEYADTWFMFGDYEFIQMDLLGIVESNYKKVYAYTCDYNESVSLMNALNGKKGCNSNITYVVSRKSWGDGDYDVRVTVTFKDEKSEYMAERNNRMNSVK